MASSAPNPYVPPTGYQLAKARARVDRVLIAKQMEELRAKLPESMKSIVDDIAEIENGAVPDNTGRAFRFDRQDLKRFCERLSILSELEITLPQFKVYILDMKKRGLSASTIRRRLRGIAALFRDAGLPSPTASPEIRAFRNRILRDMLPAIPKLAATADLVVKMLKTCDESNDADLLRKTVLAVTFQAALRRSELVGLLVEDLTWDPRGVVISLKHSKTNQTGKPETVTIPNGNDPDTCPVAILRRYLDRTGYTTGPIFRAIDRWGHPGKQAMCTETVANIVKTVAARIGLDVEKVAAHSLRRGFVKSALLARKSLKAIKSVTRHRRVQTILDYAREEAPFALTPDQFDGEGLL